MAAAKFANAAPQAVLHNNYFGKAGLDYVVVSHPAYHRTVVDLLEQVAHCPCWFGHLHHMDVCEHAPGQQLFLSSAPLDRLLSSISMAIAAKGW